MSKKREFYARWVAELVEEAEAVGWYFVRFTSHQGVMLRHPTGAQLQIYQTPRCIVQSVRNARAAIRRVQKRTG